MLETVIILLVGLLPAILSYYLMTKGIRRYARERRYYHAYRELPSERLHPHLRSQDYRYIEGLGYIVGDLSCQFNARSPYLRCAINPSGPCEDCPAYQALQFPEEQDDGYQTKFGGGDRVR